MSGPVDWSTIYLLAAFGMGVATIVWTQAWNQSRMEARLTKQNTDTEAKLTQEIVDSRHALRQEIASRLIVIEQDIQKLAIDHAEHRAEDQGWFRTFGERISRLEGTPARN